MARDLQETVVMMELLEHPDYEEIQEAEEPRAYQEV